MTDHTPGEVNFNAWDKAARAKQILTETRLRRMREGAPATTTLEEEASVAVREQFQAQTDRAALARDTQENLLEPVKPDVDEVLRRAVHAGQPRPGTPEFYRAHRMQPPEPIMVSYVARRDDAKDGKYVGKVQTRVWGVDCDPWIDMFGIENMPRLGKLAGEECTDDDIRALKKARYPVDWDKDGNPRGYSPACDLRELPEIEEGVGTEFEVKEWTAAEREEAKQYAVTGYIEAGTGDPDVPATEHMILPDDLGTSGQDS